MVRCLPKIHEALDVIILHKLGTVAHVCNPSPWEADEDQKFKGNLGYKREFKASLGHIRPCLLSFKSCIGGWGN